MPRPWGRPRQGYRGPSAYVRRLRSSHSRSSRRCEQ
jgi:hypothetical protein